MAIDDIAYEELPQLVKDNLSDEQWKRAQLDVLLEGQAVPESTQYINLKNGQIHQFAAGDGAPGPLLPVHDLSGGRGRDDTQFHTAPSSAHGTR